VSTVDGAKRRSLAPPPCESLLRGRGPWGGGGGEVDALVQDDAQHEASYSLYSEGGGSTAKKKKGGFEVSIAEGEKPHLPTGYNGKENV